MSSGHYCDGCARAYYACVCNKEEVKPVVSIDEEDLVYRLRKRAEIRRQIPTRKSVQEGKADRIANLLEEAAKEITRLRGVLYEISKHTIGRDNYQP